MLQANDNEAQKENYWYTVWILMLVYTFSFLDRQIISILAQAIKADLHLTDTQLGILTGLAFAVFYASLGIPIGILADKGNRVKIIAACLTCWSLMTAICGAAGNFIQLALARMGVGIGEAGALPCSHSIIADSVPPEKHSTAMAIFQAGVPFGIFVGFLIGGWANQWIGWRLTLVLVGLPGILLSLILILTVKEPTRKNTSQKLPAKGFAETMAIIGTLLKNKPYVYLGLATMLASMGGYCIISWVPTLLIREFGVKTGVLGSVLSMLIGIGGVIGALFVGRAADYLNKKNKLAPIYLAAAIIMFCIPFFGFGFIAKSFQSSILIMAPAYIMFLAWMGPSWAMVQKVSPPYARSTASASILLITNLIGLGLGPTMVGKLSDYFSSLAILNPLSMALICSLICFPLAAICFLFAAREIKKSEV